MVTTFHGCRASASAVGVAQPRDTRFRGGVGGGRWFASAAIAAVAVLLGALVAPAHAHYKLTKPPCRGLIEENMVTPPCGGFNSVQNPRTSWPLGTPLTIIAFHSNAQFTALLSLKDNPQQLSDWTKVGQQFLPSSGTITVAYLNGTLDNATMTALGIGNVADLVGKTGTVQTIYDAGDGVLYQCADVVFAPPNTTTSAKSSAALNAPPHGTQWSALGAAGAALAVGLGLLGL